jgi:SulP family sulfate permease
MLFVIQYSRVPTIRHIFSGINYQSSVDRSRLHTQILRQKGNWLYILELQGFIFFGTANRILDQIREHLDSTSAGQPPRYLILDFRLVTGADSSVGFSFAKILRLAQTRQIALVLTNVSAQIKKQLIPQLTAESVAYFPDLDHGIEWCENAMVASFENTDLSTEPDSLFAQLLKAMPTPAEVEILRPYLQLRDFQPGECIIQQGSLQAGLHMIEKGQVSILLECEDGSRLRLRSLSSGAFFGEMGLYTSEPASAWVIAEQATSLYQLRAEDLELLEQTAPEVAAALHRFVAAYLSERLAKMTNTIQAVMR